MIERRGEHKMFTSPQSLKKPSLFKSLTSPNPHTNSALQRFSLLLILPPKPSSNSALQRLPTASLKIPTPFCHCPTSHHTLSLLPKKPNQPCSQTQCFSIPPAKPKHLVAVGNTPKNPTANTSPKPTPMKRKSSASPKIPFLCH